MFMTPRSRVVRSIPIPTFSNTSPGLTKLDCPLPLLLRRSESKLNRLTILPPVWVSPTPWRLKKLKPDPEKLTLSRMESKACDEIFVDRSSCPQPKKSTFPEPAWLTPCAIETFFCFQEDVAYPSQHQKRPLIQYRKVAIKNVLIVRVPQTRRRTKPTMISNRDKAASFIVFRGCLHWPCLTTRKLLHRFGSPCAPALESVAAVARSLFASIPPPLCPYP